MHLVLECHENKLWMNLLWCAGTVWVVYSVLRPNWRSPKDLTSNTFGFCLKVSTNILPFAKKVTVNSDISSAFLLHFFCMCSRNAVEMLEKCYRNVTKMSQNCIGNVVELLKKCKRNDLQMLWNCCRNVSEVKWKYWQNIFFLETFFL